MKNAAFQRRRNGQPQGPGRDTFSESSHASGNLGGMDHLLIEAGSLSSFKGSGRTHNPMGDVGSTVAPVVVFRDKVIGSQMARGNICGLYLRVTFDSSRSHIGD